MARQQDPTTSGPVRVDRLRPDQATEAGDVLAASHAEYPSFRQLFPERRRRHRVLRPFLAATVRDAATNARALAASDGSGMLGVALWMPPGTFPLSARRKARMTPAMLQVALAAGRAFPAFARVGATLERHHPDGASWYLQALGVQPRAQRRGVGRQLLVPFLTLADEAGVPCHLHTSDPANVAYYERFGFDVSQPGIEVFPGGPTYLGMTRPPRRATPAG